jgi:hypothetical protein
MPLARISLIILAILGSVVAVRPTGAQESAPDTVTLITGEQRQVRIQAITDGVLRGADGTTLRLDELMLIRTGRTVVVEKGTVRVWLSAGGQLAAAAVQFDGEQFVLQTPAGQWTVPPEAVQGVLFNQDVDLSRFERALDERSADTDILIATTEQGQGVVRGLIESITDDRVVFNYEGRSRSITLERVVGLVTADLKPERPGGPTGTVRLTNGSSLTAGIGDLGEGQLMLLLPGQATIRLPESAIASISLQSDRVRFLSDLDPLEVSCNPLATPRFTWQRDLSVRGQPLRLRWPGEGGVREFSRGIGTHAECRLEFENPDGFNRFVATVGIDAETDGKGDCEVSVWGDGIRLWEAEIRGNTAPLPVEVDISGMRRVALVVRNGRHLDLGDHVDWAEARFLKVDQALEE